MDIDRQFIFVDLDGTLGDIAHRVHLAQAKDWDAFHSMMMEDKVNEDVRAIINDLGETFHVVLFTGRSEEHHANTLLWLARNGVYWDDLIMRPNGDPASDHELKPRMIQEFFEGQTSKNKKPVAILEDRDKVVEALRNLGYNVWQVRQGTY